MQPAPRRSASPSVGGARGDESFERLYRDHYAAIISYCVRRTNWADAHDAAAEVFAIAWRKRHELPGDERLRSWLYGVAYRVLGHQWRSRRRWGRLQERVGGAAVAEAPDPASVIVRRSQDEAIIRAALSLKATDREILRMAAWEELPHAEIADALGLSVAAVDQRFHRAKRRLAREYERLTEQRSPNRAQKGGGG